MNKHLRIVLLAALTLAILLLATSCKSTENPYDTGRDEGYTVNIRYDANGGTFATNTSVIVDSYNPEDFPSGKLPLIAPEDEDNRPAAKLPQNDGFILAGWYTERTPVLDGEGNHLDYDGNIASESGMTPAYTFTGHWDFKNDRLDLSTLEGDGITLYAAWVPEFYFEFYDIDSGEKIGERKAVAGEAIAIPVLNPESGKVEKKDFPELFGKTYDSFFLDSEGNNPISGSTVTHTGVIDLATATATGSVMKIYTKLLDGLWYSISTPEQLISRADPTAHDVLNADLDFEGSAWPLSSTFMGSIIGNGHKISNITLKQSQQSNLAGVFKSLEAGATVEDVTFENVTYTISAGNKNPDISYGLFAGRISEGATVRNVAVSGKLIISSKALNGSLTQTNGDYSVGLVAGTGYENCDIDYSAITVEALNEDTRYSVTVSADGNTVSWVREKL